ncbi:MAG TPA: ATP-binding cassette domain-containing protein, partial [Pirellulales bacterium]|nr:ATP-binding cassette domain-containing protein [Pirellulales bacterium]
PSGSGKTTLLAMLGGLLTPTAGDVAVGGLELASMPASRLARFRREHVGFVFQGYNLLPYLTARKNLLVMAAIGRLDRSAAARRADRLLDELGLADRGGAYPAEMSGGEQQRIAIGRALMNDPDLILVDEPTANLDSVRGRRDCRSRARVSIGPKRGYFVQRRPEPIDAEHQAVPRRARSSSRAKTSAVVYRGSFDRARRSSSSSLMLGETGSHCEGSMTGTKWPKMRPPSSQNTSASLKSCNLARSESSTITLVIRWSSYDHCSPGP